MPKLLTSLVVALMALQSPAAPAAFVTGNEAAAVLKELTANDVVDKLMAFEDTLGGRAGVAMLHRTRPEATALTHDRATEIYYILEGSGTLMTGGTMSDLSPVDLTDQGAGPSWRGTEHGGTTRRIGPKDTVVIPAGVPHHFTELDGTINYLVYRFDMTAVARDK
jgi:mannose-6-phosphate isomerase-like protein (cupin superfamily)